MPSDQTIGWIILAVTVAAFAVFGVFLWYGRRLKYPPGCRRDVERNGLRLVVVSEPGVLKPETGLWDLADACLDAVEATIEAWTELKLPGDVRSKLDRMCVLFLSNEVFDQPVPGSDWAEDWVDDQAAYVAQVPRATGGGPPMLVIRARYGADVIDTGEPVIHETLHPCCQAGNLGYRDHNDPRIWIDAGVLDGREPEVNIAQSLAWLLFEETRNPVVQ